MTINQTAISGNLVRDAELRNTTTGAVLRFTVASNEWRKDAEQHTNYFDCVMFGARAEKVAQYLTKGTKAVIGGRLHYSSYTAKDGGKRSRVEIYVNELEFMSRNENAGNAPRPSQPYTSGAPQYATAEIIDTDIPF